MGNNSDIFRAGSSTVWDIFNAHNGGVGFKIPVYQRQYDWKKSDIERLFESIVNGFVRLEKQPQSLTFLGTLILVIEGEKEPKFSGTSLAIVDGQQRLISLSLIIGELQAKIYPLLSALKSDTVIKKEARWWLADQVNDLLDQLFVSNIGSIHSRSPRNTVCFLEQYYPRLIRDGDYRAKSSKDSEYLSNISKYLVATGKTIIDKKYSFNFRDQESPDSETFNTCMDNIDKMLSDVKQGEFLEFEFPSINNLLRKSNYKKFFKNTNDHRKHEKLCSSICNSNSEKIDHLVRLLLFGNYLLGKVNLVNVEVNHESEAYAYDIFESLNTTGEPLTAIQTLKPRVIQYLEGNGKNYSGSEEEVSFEKIERYLSPYREKETLQSESAEVVIFLGYYLYGKKVPRSLSIQRTFLRDRYDKLEAPSSKKKYIKAIQDITDYREQFWSKTKIVESCARSSKDSDLLGFCLLFISAMKTTMSIPILVRYWIYSKEKNDPAIFVDAVKSLTAFLALRRSITSGTSGIDTDFRDILKNGNLGGQPLSVFDKNGKENVCLDIQTLKNCFKFCLSSKEKLLGKIEKELWVNQVTKQDAYKVKALCKFFLIVAAHNTEPDDKDPCILITRFHDLSLNRMTASCWMHPDYETIEHIAPQSSVPVNGWDDEIYNTLNLNGSIGNLTLLPNFDNSTVGNKPWNTKKLYYKAFLAKNENELEKSIKKADKEGCAFGKKLEKNLRERKETRLILGSIANVNEWNKQTIQRRGRNIAELVWDNIAPWLDFK